MVLKHCCSGAATTCPGRPGFTNRAREFHRCRIRRSYFAGSPGAFRFCRVLALCSSRNHRFIVAPRLSHHRELLVSDPVHGKAPQCAPRPGFANRRCCCWYGCCDAARSSPRSDFKCCCPGGNVPCPRRPSFATKFCSSCSGIGRVAKRCPTRPGFTRRLCKFGLCFGLALGGAQRLRFTVEPVLSLHRELLISNPVRSDLPRYAPRPSLKTQLCGCWLRLLRFHQIQLEEWHRALLFWGGCLLSQRVWRPQQIPRFLFWRWSCRFVPPKRGRASPGVSASLVSVAGLCCAPASSSWPISLSKLVAWIHRLHRWTTGEPIANSLRIPQLRQLRRCATASRRGAQLKRLLQNDRIKWRLVRCHQGCRQLAPLI